APALPPPPTYQTQVILPHAQVDPITQVAGLAGPVGTIISAPIRIGELIANALGLNQGSISDFDPWLSPDDQPLFHEAIVEALARQVAMYDPATGRFLHPDGSVAIIAPPMTDRTGYVLAATGTNSREMLTLWKLRREAAIRFNFDRSKVEADGYTPKPPPAPPPI